MSTNADLMGLGLPAALAQRLSNNVAAVTAAGTGSTTATALSGSHTYVVTAATNQTGVILNAAESIGEVIWITNPSATSASVYPPSGSTFATSASSSLTLAQFKTAAVIRVSSTSFAVLLTA